MKMKKLFILFFVVGCSSFKKTNTFKNIENLKKESSEIKQVISNVNTQYQHLIYEKPECLELSLNNNIIAVNEKMSYLEQNISNLENVYRADYNYLRDKIRLEQLKFWMSFSVNILFIYLWIKKKL